MNNESRPPVDVNLFLKALQVETGRSDPYSEDEVIEMAESIEIEDDNAFRLHVSERLKEGESARTIFENAEVAEEFNQLLSESTEEFSEQTLAMNAAFKDLFEPDDDESETDQ